MSIEDPQVRALAALMDRVRLTVNRDAAGWTIGYENERHPLPHLPLADLDPAAERAELLAIAVGLEAAIKFPLAPRAESFRQGAGALLPRLERARMAAAYDLVVAARGEPDDARLFTTPFGAGLTVTYVLDEGWRFRYLTRAQVAAWDVSPGTIAACGRSNLYARSDPERFARDARVTVGDGLDPDRAVLADDAFYARFDGGALRLAVPSREALLVGPSATATAVRAAYDASQYPLSPYPLRYTKGVVEATA